MEENQRKEITPEWLTSSFLEKAFQCGLKCPKLKVISYNCESATSVGDNYCSKIIRAHLTIIKSESSDSEKTTVMIKIPTSGMEGLAKTWNMFEKEGNTLYVVLPEIHNILKRFNKQQKPLWPNCYFTMTSPDTALVLEDLRPAEFVLADKCAGLDMDHCTLVLTSMAKLHAASLVLRKENPKVLEPCEANFWSRDHAIALECFMRPSFRKFSEKILKWTEIENRVTYSENFKMYSNTISDQVTKIWERDDFKVNVLLHGDCWVNNFMFKYLPSGRVSDIKFLDFQFVCLNSPVLDLHNFIFTSITPGIMFNEIDTFLQIYHQAFVSTLKKLNYHLSYTLDELKEEFDRKCKWGLIYMVVYMPGIIQSKSTTTAEDFFDEKKMENQFEKLDLTKVRKIFNEGLPFFEKKGVLGNIF